MKLLTYDDERRTTTNDERRTTDIQGITKAHPEHSSGEVKTLNNIQQNLFHNTLLLYKITCIML